MSDPLLGADTIVTCRPWAANRPRCCAMYRPAESSAGTAATVRFVFSRPVGAAEPPPLEQAAASRAAAASAPTTGIAGNGRNIMKLPYLIFPRQRNDKLGIGHESTRTSNSVALLSLELSMPSPTAGRPLVSSSVPRARGDVASSPVSGERGLVARLWVSDAEGWQVTSVWAGILMRPDLGGQVPGPGNSARPGPSHEPPGGQGGTASGDRVSRLGCSVWRPVRLGGPQPRPGRQSPHPERHLPRDHALSGGALGAVRAVAVGRVALLHPQLAFPAPCLTAGRSGERRPGADLLADPAGPGAHGGRLPGDHDGARHRPAPAPPLAQPAQATSRGA